MPGESRRGGPARAGILSWRARPSRLRTEPDSAVRGSLRSAHQCRSPRSTSRKEPGNPPELAEIREQRITPLSVVEVQDLANAMPERCRAMVITQAGLGLRVAELLGLRVQDVDFSGVRFGSNSRRPRTASTEYRPRHQDHDAPCRYRKWSAGHSRRTSLNFRRPMTAHSSPRPTEICTGTTITARGSLLQL